MGLKEEKTDFWIRNNNSVVLVGRNGVGKTALVEDTIKRNNLQKVARYQSHDSDFYGDPTDADLIYFDDLNDPKAQLAMKGILGTGLWRGRPVSTKRVWASYTVGIEDWSSATLAVESRLKEIRRKHEKRIVADPNKTINELFDLVDTIHESEASQRNPHVFDYFDVAVEFPYRLPREYFVQKYGKAAEAAIEWWEQLPQDEKYKVSPRRMEVALDMWKAKGDIRDVLPITANVSKLMSVINTGPLSDKLDQLLAERDDTATRLFFVNANNREMAKKYIIQNENYQRYFLPLFQDEILAAWISDENPLLKFVLENHKTEPVFEKLLKRILEANMNRRLVKAIRRYLVEHS